MRFGRHIGRGLWAFADKALPAVYGIGFILLVIRVLPEREYGAFVVVHTVRVTHCCAFPRANARRYSSCSTTT